MNDDDLDRLLRDYGEHWRTTQAQSSTMPMPPVKRAPARWQLRRVAPALAAVAAAIVLAGVVVTTGTHRHDGSTAVGSAGSGPAASQPSGSIPSLPGTSPSSKPIHADRLAGTSGPGILPVGAQVPGSEVAHPTRLHSRVLVGLGSKGALFGTAYPVRSTDGGDHWRISGPRMYVAAAHGASVADSVGVLPDGTTYIWGRGGNFIRVAQDGMPPWYAANLPPVTRVWNQGNTLLARTYPEPQTPRLFRSTDDGRTWTSR